MPPPIMTIPASRVSVGGGSLPSRRAWPRAELPPMIAPLKRRFLAGPRKGVADAIPSVTKLVPRKARRESILVDIMSPFLFEVADQHLVIEPICFHLHRAHVRREMEHVAGAGFGDELKSVGQMQGLGKRLVGGQNIAPFAKGGHIQMIRLGYETADTQRFIDTPERFSSHPRGSALDNQSPVRAEGRLHTLVKRGGVKFAQRKVRWV